MSAVEYRPSRQGFSHCPIKASQPDKSSDFDIMAIHDHFDRKMTAISHFIGFIRCGALNGTYRTFSHEGRYSSADTLIITYYSSHDIFRITLSMNMAVSTYW